MCPEQALYGHFNRFRFAITHLPAVGEAIFDSTVGVLTLLSGIYFHLYINAHLELLRKSYVQLLVRMVAMREMGCLVLFNE